MAKRPLKGVRYPLVARALWRWVDAAEDATIERFLRAFVAADTAEQAVIRSRLSRRAVTQLQVYAGRCALAGLRSNDIGRVVAGFDALSAIDPEAMWDDRDAALIALRLTLVGQHLVYPLTDTIAPAVCRAVPEMAAVLAEIAAEDIRDGLGDATGERVVDSPEGPVFIEDLGDDPYDPTLDLVALAMAAVTLFEADGKSLAEISVDTLQHYYPGERRPDAVDRVRAILRVTAEPPQLWRWRRGVELRLVEAADGSDALVLAAAAAGVEHRPVIAMTHGPLCALLEGDFGFTGKAPKETRSSLERFRPGLMAILADATGADRTDPDTTPT